MRLFFALIAVSLATTGQAQSPLADSDRWRTHLTDDLVPFWSNPAAAGNPQGSFAGNLCNDGTAPNVNTPCAGVDWSRARYPRQTIVGHSRQVFSYAVAFHMTGQKVYLDLAQASVA